MTTQGYRQIFFNGLIHNNQGTVALLGLCPLLAVSNTTINALSMGLATLFVLFVSNTLISLCRKYINHSLRVPIFVTIIASTVTIVELCLNAWWHELYQSLGVFIALIVTNCLILARADGFASKNPVIHSMVDALGMGLGFLAVLIILGMTRELLGQGTLFANADQLLGAIATTWTVQLTNFKLLISLLPPGAFIALALLIALSQKLKATPLPKVPLQQSNQLHQ